ncbi:hypothetical protein FF1_027514 [Malus domestica]
MSGDSRGFAGIVIHDAHCRCIKVARVEVIASSALMVESIAIWEGFLPILSRVLALGSSFQACTWSWILRSANATRTLLRNYVWVERPPSLLVGILNKDSLSCSP